MFSTIFSLILSAAPMVAVCDHTCGVELENHHRNHIQIEELNSWYEEGKTMTVVDARTKEYFDGTLLPNAIWLPADATEQDIEAALPVKDALIVVYCYSTQCPASGWLYDKLNTLGYTNLREFSEGIVVWMEKGNPTQK